MKINKKLTLFTILAIFIIVVIIIFTYVNDETQRNEEQNDEIEQEIGSVLISFIDTNDTSVKPMRIFFTTDLEEMNPITGQGSNAKSHLLPVIVEIEESHNFTGVPIENFIGEFVDAELENYSIIVTDSEGIKLEYTMNQVMGLVDVYDENGTLLENQTATMILAYAEDGQYYHEIDPENEIGPLRIVFVGEDNPITSSDLWLKKVYNIDIINQS